MPVPAPLSVEPVESLLEEEDSELEEESEVEQPGSAITRCSMEVIFYLALFMVNPWSFLMTCREYAQLLHDRNFWENWMSTQLAVYGRYKLYCTLYRHLDLNQSEHSTMDSATGSGRLPFTNWREFVCKTTTKTLLSRSLIDLSFGTYEVIELGDSVDASYAHSRVFTDREGRLFVPLAADNLLVLKVFSPANADPMNLPFFPRTHFGLSQSNNVRIMATHARDQIYYYSVNGNRDRHQQFIFPTEINLSGVASITESPGFVYVGDHRNNLMCFGTEPNGVVRHPWVLTFNRPDGTTRPVYHIQATLSLEILIAALMTNIVFIAQYFNLPSETFLHDEESLRDFLPPTFQVLICSVLGGFDFVCAKKGIVLREFRAEVLTGIFPRTVEIDPVNQHLITSDSKSVMFFSLKDATLLRSVPLPGLEQDYISDIRLTSDRRLVVRTISSNSSKLVVF